MKQSPVRNLMSGIVGGAVALLTITTAHGDDNNTKPVAATSDSSPASAGMMAAKDPETGALVQPSAEQMAALSKPVPATKTGRDAKAAAPVEFRYPNGTVVTTLDASTQVYEVAVKKDDGKIVSVCVQGDKVDATLKAAQAGKVTKKEVLDEK